MTRKRKVADRQKFQKQVDELNDAGRAISGDDWLVFDEIPNFTGKDEPIPFPYGSERGEGFGTWGVPPKKVR